ncbi:hypothetical protein [Spirosoma flavum]|uniref:Response regulatory domain-containing protein n=1 Tax=Spirosoma flavum TaxID=2048557 RepID=A0ABW6AI76_9BACT
MPDLSPFYMAIRLLVIDDEDQIRHHLVDLLTRLGFAVTSTLSVRSDAALASQVKRAAGFAYPRGLSLTPDYTP